MKINSKNDTTEPTACRGVEEERKALRKRWKRFVGDKKPRKALPERFLPSVSADPPLLLYGWPFKGDYLIEYAKRHRLVYHTNTENRQLLDDKEDFNFGDITERHYANPVVMDILDSAAYLVVMRQLVKATGIPLYVGRPLSLDYDSILYMCTNYTFEEEFETEYVLDRYEQIVKILDDAMNEGCEGKRTKPRWWWSWDGNDVGVFNRKG